MEQTQTWLQRVQTLQHQLYQLRERALKANDHETAERCKRLLHESERIFKVKAQSWIADAELLLEKQDVETRSTMSSEQ